MFSRGNLWIRRVLMAFKGWAGWLVKSITGSYSNVVGMPLAEIVSGVNKRKNHLSCDNTSEDNQALMMWSLVKVDIPLS